MLTHNQDDNQQVKPPLMEDDHARRVRKAAATLSLALLALVLSALSLAASGQTDTSVFFNFAQSHDAISESIGVMVEEFYRLKAKIKARIKH
ncbi:hypothetical protein ACFYWP_39870 [Actinacidiphila glaucinigra]|uniref:hypothetical protein n=1 Tax=Actinacidiphila glaucinigra TaxID=235986 RepID=UPI0036871426